MGQSGLGQEYFEGSVIYMMRVLNNFKPSRHELLRAATAPMVQHYGQSHHAHQVSMDPPNDQHGHGEPPHGADPKTHVHNQAPAAPVDHPKGHHDQADRLQGAASNMLAQIHAPVATVDHPQGHHE